MSGHGHVVPRPDGAKARCGGPALCSACAREKAQQVDPKLSAAKDALAAFKADDPKALSEALSAFVECCGYEGEE